MNMTLTIPDAQHASKKITLWTHPALDKRARFMSFVLAVLMHLALFSIGGFVLAKGPEYGLEMNQGGIDIYLVAAPEPEKALAINTLQQPSTVPNDAEIEMPVLQSVPQASKEENHKPIKLTQQAEVQGDGSSQVAGKNKTTFSSVGSGQTDAKPGYLKNPPPAYPYEALQKGQEGLVVLAVLVDRFGSPKRVGLKQSSGFELLDEAALKAIRKWKFSPGKIGALAVDSEVMVPVRFRLADAVKR